MAIDPINFLDLGKVKSDITIHKHALMGHNRQATKGAVNSANAHPFQHGDITLMHNGTLTNKYALERTFNAPTFDTDSELVCWLIDNYDLPAVIKELEGAFALTWWDSSDNTINIINNGEREFHMAAVDSNVYWASEKMMLQWLMDRSSISKVDTKFVSPKVGSHLKFSWTMKDGMSLVKEDLELAPEKKPTGKAATGAKSTGGCKSTGVSQILTQKDAIEAFSADHPYNLELGDKIFVYLNSVNYDYLTNRERVLLGCTLAIEPYCPVKVHYVVDDVEYNPEDVYGMEVEVKSVSKVDGKYRINAQNRPAAIKVIHENDTASVKAMDDWVYNYTPPFLPAPDEAEDLVVGYANRSITFKKFSNILKRGCCVCDATLDPETEAVDRSVLFVSDDDVLCSGCANNSSVMRYYGFDADLRGNVQ